jgi:hypothetical protein
MYVWPLKSVNSVAEREPVGLLGVHLPTSLECLVENLLFGFLGSSRLRLVVPK